VADSTIVERHDPARPVQRSFIREHPLGSIAGLIVILVIAGAAFLWWRYSRTFEDTDDAQIEGHVNAISTRVAGTVVAVYVTENQQVKQGDLLVELDPRDYVVAVQRAQASHAQALADVRVEAPSVPITTTTATTNIATSRANVATAQAAVAVAKRDYESQLARVAQAEAVNARAQADLQRYTILVNKDEVSREEYDQRVAAARSAAAALDSERAAAGAALRVIEEREAGLTQAESQLDQAISNAPQEISAKHATVELRRAAAESAEATTEEARLNLSYTKIYAPVTGVLGRKSVEIGQRVQPGQQLLSLVPLDDIWVTANFKETQLRQMRAGQGVRIHVDAFDQNYEGYVESMPPATSARFSILPPENASGNYVKVVQRLPVRIRFKAGQDPEHRLRPGLSVVPKVWIN
jgi:membrane fusion protein (multidrug efflux system)